MHERIINVEHVPKLDGVPFVYHHLEQCQTGLGWSTYAQDEAHEQHVLQQLYTDLIDQADASCVNDT